MYSTKTLVTFLTLFQNRFCTSNRVLNDFILAILAAATAMDPNVLSKYCGGYNECMAEVSRFYDEAKHY